MDWVQKNPHAPPGHATAPFHAPAWPVESIYITIPEIEKSILSVPPVVPLHVTTEATTAVMHNVDSSTGTPLSIVFLVSLAVAVILPLIILVTSLPTILAVEN
jgi:hypothetical protein